MTTAGALVEDYLGRLDRAATTLPPDRRAELVAEIGEHIAAALEAGDPTSEAQVRTVLDRLGQPDEIVAAAREHAGALGAPAGSQPGWGDPAWGDPVWGDPAWGGPGPGEPGWGGPGAAGPGRVGPGWVEAPVLRRRGTGLELAAVLMLTAGSFIPVLGWLVGVLLLWTSTRWTWREKLLGTLVVPLGPGGVLVLGGLLPLRMTCSSEATYAGPDVPPLPTAPVPLAPPPTPPGQPTPPAPAGAPALPEGPPEGWTTADGVVETCSATGPAGWVVALVIGLLLLLPIVVAVVLYRTARRRAAS